MKDPNRLRGYHISLRVRGMQVFSADFEQFQLRAVEEIFCAAIRRAANDQAENVNVEVLQLEIHARG